MKIPELSALCACVCLCIHICFS